LPKWQELLASNPPERKVQDFLEAHPVLLPGAIGDIGPGGHHGPEVDGVFREPPLKGLAKIRRPDFMWVTHSTSLITPICIEIERPNKRWFTGTGLPTAELTQAMDQLIDWKVWFSEPENQSIFRKTYVQEEWGDRQLLPQYLLIFGRAREFAVTGGHRRPDRLRKKRDFMLRENEYFMTFDSLRPRRELEDFVTLSMTADGPELWAVPPSFSTGPPTVDLARWVRNDVRNAFNKTGMWSDARKAHVIERWLHWQQVADAKDDITFRSLATGE
jgi:hypothetical protein